MMTLPLPAACSLQLVDDVVAERVGGVNEQFFADLAVEWRSRVANYLAQGGAVQNIPTWPFIADNKARKASFINLYTHPKPGSAQGVVIDALREHGLDTCPACGEGAVPKTLDHYLPKGDYPQFAITPANLFPMCATCQGAKLEKTGDALTPRYFIHPYFDTFSQPQIVQLTIDGAFQTPGFALGPHPALPNIEQVLVGTHLRELDIHARYITFFRNEHSRLMRSVTRLRASGQDVIPSLEGFAFKAAYPTPNGWEHLFYDGVLSNLDMLDYLTHGVLPNLP